MSAPATATVQYGHDLTFTGDWGDGAPATAAEYCNVGVGSSPYPSPNGTFPLTATDVSTHVFLTAGTFKVILTVANDDGGESRIPFVIGVG